MITIQILHLFLRNFWNMKSFVHLMQDSECWFFFFSKASYHVAHRLWVLSKTLNLFSSRRYLLKYTILMCHSLKQTNFPLKCNNFLFFIIKLIKYLVYLFNLLIIVYCNINLKSNFCNLISIVCGFRV